MVQPCCLVQGKEVLIILNFRGIQSERLKMDLVTHEVVQYILEIDDMSEGGKAAELRLMTFARSGHYKDYNMFCLGKKCIPKKTGSGIVYNFPL
jgi:hypothetical protein